MVELVAAVGIVSTEAASSTRTTFQSLNDWVMLRRHGLPSPRLPRMRIHGRIWWFFWEHLNGYGSIPINTIFSGMNIHKSQLFLGFTRGTRFWHTAKWSEMTANFLAWGLNLDPMMDEGWWWSNGDDTATEAQGSGIRGLFGGCDQGPAQGLSSPFLTLIVTPWTYD